MDIRIHSGELNRIARIMAGSVDSRNVTFSNVEICHENNMVTFRAYSGVEFLNLSVPLMGGDGEKVRIDGKLLQKVASVQKGEVHIVSDGKAVTFRGTGRTKIPIVQGDVMSPGEISGDMIRVKGSYFLNAINKTAYAISTDQTRVILTGALVETERGTMRMVALDGFQMSVENCPYLEGELKTVIPGGTLDRFKQCILADDIVTITTDGKRVRIAVPGAEIISGVLQGEYIEYQKLIPNDPITEARLRTENVKQALRGAMEIGDVKMPIKLSFSGNRVRITSNSAMADFEETLDCELMGQDMNIAFMGRYMMNALAAVEDEYITVKMRTSVAPAVIHTNDGKGTRLFLPVRVFDK